MVPSRCENQTTLEKARPANRFCPGLLPEDKKKSTRNGRQKAQVSHSCHGSFDTIRSRGLAPSHLQLHGDVVLDWHSQQCGRLNFEVRELAGNVSGDLPLLSLNGNLKGHVF